jgi:HK97 gp10 family phage protein
MATKMQGRESLLRKLHALPYSVQAAMRTSVPMVADSLAAMQQRLAPLGGTGALKASIRTEKIDDLKTAVIAGGTAETRREIRQGSGVFTDEAILVEFGVKRHKLGGKFKGAIHKGTPARPFFYPAYRAMKKSIKSKISRDVGKAIKQVAQRP